VHLVTQEGGDTRNQSPVSIRQQTTASHVPCYKPDDKWRQLTELTSCVLDFRSVRRMGPGASRS
jgi:hypothetical protein